MSERILSIVGACLVMLGLGLSPRLQAHAAHTDAGWSPAHAQVSPEKTVLIGLGQLEVSQGSALSFTPRYLDVTVGDTVVFKDVDALEPHTVSFGPLALLKDLASKDQLVAIPQRTGPPLLAFNPKVAFPTTTPMYDGMGFANSGLLQNGKSWSLTFTQPGTYEYVCLLHGLAMNGYVIVHAAQLHGPLYHVLAGDGGPALRDRANTTTNDAFYPQALTIHVGNSVQWSGRFHTISFGSAALIKQLQKSFIVPLMQKAGPPLLMLNPKVALPSGGTTYDGTGFVNSGTLVLAEPPGSSAVPSFTLTFTKAGTYPYVCLLHPGMDGTITVLP